MSKRGRPLLPPDQRCTEVVSVKVPRMILVYMQSIASSRDMTIPELTRWWYKRLYEKKPEYRVTEKTL